MKILQIVKRRVPAPLIEYEQRTLKFTLSKSRKKEGNELESVLRITVCL